MVTVRRRGKLIEKLRVARLTTRKHRLLLRSKGHVPRRGSYTLRVTQGQLLTRRARL